MVLSPNFAAAPFHSSGQITSCEGDISSTTFKELRNHFFSKTEGDLQVSIEPLKDFKFVLENWIKTAEKIVTFCEKEIWKKLQSEKTCSMFSSFEEWNRVFKLSPLSYRMCSKSHDRALGLMKDREKYFDCARICKGMYNSVNQETDEKKAPRKKAECHEPEKAIVVRDVHNKLQALATFSFAAGVSDYCNITHIVSAPQNIKTIVIKNEKPIRGAARAALVRGVFITLEKHLSSETLPKFLLYVEEAYPSAKGFYSSCGMHLIGDAFAFTPKEAKEFLENEKLAPVKCLDQSKAPV
jgi:hypothetical protein